MLGLMQRLKKLEEKNQNENADKIVWEIGGVSRAFKNGDDLRDAWFGAVTGTLEDARRVVGKPSDIGRNFLYSRLNEYYCDALAELPEKELRYLFSAIGYDDMLDEFDDQE